MPTGTGCSSDLAANVLVSLAPAGSSVCDESDTSTVFFGTPLRRQPNQLRSRYELVKAVTVEA
jgi:hypothetical protein